MKTSHVLSLNVYPFTLISQPCVVFSFYFVIITHITRVVILYEIYETSLRRVS